MGTDSRKFRILGRKKNSIVFESLMINHQIEILAHKNFICRKMLKISENTD